MKTMMCWLLAAAGGLWLAPCYGQTEQKPKFDASLVQRLLEASRPNSLPSDKTSSREIYAIAGQLKRCWSVPKINNTNNKAVAVEIRVKLKPDGSLDGEPQVLTETKDEVSRKFARSAAAAIALCQPFRLSEANYQNWKELDMHFTTEDLSQPKLEAKPAAKPETKSRQ